ncbi:MAG: type III-B CRISPR module RAMP protein Cmr4 [Verrucomicrobiia bacterium]
MNRKVLYLFTRTPLHVGAGTSVGAIDQPIQRERHTGYPIIPGSSLKGVLRDTCRNDNGFKSKEEGIFGKQDDAGKLAIGEAKVLAFPVRSSRGSFAFVTSTLALDRFRREQHGGLQQLPTLTEPQEMQCLAGDAVTIKRNGQTGIVLEEYKFTVSGIFPPEWEKALLGLLPDDSVWQTGKGRFVLLSHGDFSHFVRNACEVGQHVGINPETGTAKKGALFNLEAVPAETLFFAPVEALSRANDELKDLEGLLQRKPVIQIGGDSTTGLGFCTAKLS